MFEVEEGADLITVGDEIAGDVLVGQLGALIRAAGRITDLGGHVADDEDHLMAHALEPAQDEHRYRVPQVDVAAGRVDAELGDERPVLLPGFDDALGQGGDRGL